MKISKQELRQLIKEELSALLSELAPSTEPLTGTVPIGDVEAQQSAMQGRFSKALSKISDEDLAKAEQSRITQMLSKIKGPYSEEALESEETKDAVETIFKYSGYEDISKPEYSPTPKDISKPEYNP